MARGAPHPSTDDVYLRPEVLEVAAEVGGPVTDVLVSENRHVAAGDILFALDAADLRAARDAARGQADLGSHTISAGGTNVGAAEAQLRAAGATPTDARAWYDRQRRLLDLGDVVQAALERANSGRDQATVQAAAQLAAARDQVGAAGGNNALTRDPRRAEPGRTRSRPRHFDGRGLRLGREPVLTPAADGATVTAELRHRGGTAGGGSTRT